MNRCGTCAFWGDEEHKGKKFRPCKAIIHDDECHNKMSEEAIERRLRFDMDPDYRRRLKEEMEMINDQKAVTEDGSGYYAALKTRKDFACCLWEAKP